MLFRAVWMSWATCSRKMQVWLCCSSILTRLSRLCLWGFLSLSPLESLAWSVLPLGFVLWHAQTPSWWLYVPHPHHSQKLNYHWELYIVATVMISYITFDLLSVCSHKHTVANLSLLPKPEVAKTKRHEWESTPSRYKEEHKKVGSQHKKKREGLVLSFQYRCM